MSEINSILTVEENRIRQRLIEAASYQLTQVEFDDSLLSQIAAKTGYSLDRVHVFFQDSEDVVMALYARFAGDLESRILELPEGTLSERFYALMKIKFEIMEPYRKTLRGLAGNLSDRSSKLGVLSHETGTIRIRVRSVLAAAIEGATDHNSRSTDVLSQGLYSIYLAIMWLWFKEKSGSNTKSEMSLNVASKVISFSTPFLKRLPFRLPLKLFAAIHQSLLIDENQAANEKASEILKLLFKYRRLIPDSDSCDKLPCAQCVALHLPRVAYFVAIDRPIHLILPAFPAKSPNRRKTLGALPDMAEEQSLLYLANICAELRTIYPAGVRMTICSDGHVFSDLVGVSDNDVTAYGQDIRRIIDRLGISNTIDTFALSDLYENVDLPTMRENLNRHYEQSLEIVRERAVKIPQTAILVNGIHRFLFEDHIELYPDRSRTQVRNECRDLAYRVVQRSDGWGRLLSDCFPMALRLSIHPQAPHSDKIGILLGPANDVWLTPWHSVAVKENGRFKMMRRHEAEALGARLVQSGAEHARFYEL